MGKFANVLIVTDLDGTLLDSQKKIGVASREAIRYFISQGGSFTFATGRLYQSFLGIRKRVIYNAPIVFANGAQIINMGDANILYQLPLESDMIPICEDVLSAFPEAALEVYAHKRCGVVRFNDISLKHMLDFSIEHTLYQTVPMFLSRGSKCCLPSVQRCFQRLPPIFKTVIKKPLSVFHQKTFWKSSMRTRIKGAAR